MERTLALCERQIECRQKIENFIRKIHILQEDIKSFIERKRLTTLFSKLKI